MSVQAQAWVWEHADVGGSELLVLLAIANDANADGRHAYPGRKRLAELTRMSERQVIRLVQNLVGRGVIVEEGISQYRTVSYAIAGMGDRLSPSAAAGGDMGVTSPTGGHAQGGDMGVTQLRHPTRNPLTQDPLGDKLSPPEPTPEQRERLRTAQRRVRAELEAKGIIPGSTSAGVGR